MIKLNKKDLKGISLKGITLSHIRLSETPGSGGSFPIPEGYMILNVGKLNLSKLR